MERPGQFVLTLTLAGTLLLTAGCSGGKGAASQMAAAQAAYSQLTQFTARGEVTADYGQRVYGYTVDAEGTPGAGAMTVTEPEQIAGTVLTWSDGETELEYDGAELDTGALSQDGLSPADALPALLTACAGGTVVDCCTETADGAELLYATLELPEQEGVQFACWFRPEDYALSRAELSQDGRVVVTLDFAEFSFRTEAQAES